MTQTKCIFSEKKGPDLSWVMMFHCGLSLNNNQQLQFLPLENTGDASLTASLLILPLTMECTHRAFYKRSDIQCQQFGAILFWHLIENLTLALK